LRDGWQDGAIKLYLVRELIALRNRHPDLFTAGGYRALEAAGTHADRVCAFLRHHEGATLVVAVARHFAAITRTGDTHPDPRTWSGMSIALPADSPPVFRNVLTGRPTAVFEGALRLDELFATLPVAVLVATR
jgi:(1->4)-alpha-D-glucan 1-alpha-D-glucosylmutase